MKPLRSVIVAVCCLVYLLYISGCSSSSPGYTATINEGRTAAREMMEQTGASSISLALIDGEQVVWTETFGLADKASRTAPSADTMYCIGSTSKMVAAIAVMKLVDLGLISLDRPLRNYITSFSMASPEYAQVTVRMLLNHSAGFPGGDYRNSETSTPLPFSFSAQVLETLKTQRLKHAPGYMSVYANDGFTLIEQLVSAVTGKSYAQFVQEEIFTPLGMNTSRYPLDYFPDGSFAKRYADDSPQPQLFLNSFGSGGLYSTPGDMAKIAMMFLKKGKVGTVRILSEASVAAMGVDQTLFSFNPVKSKSFSYGLGWDTVIQPGLGAVGVTGWQKGGDVTLYGSAMIVAPADGLAVVVMGASNSFGSGSATVIAERILLRALAEKGRIAAMPTPLNLPTRPLKTASSGQLDSAVGYYASNSTVMRVQKQPDDSLSIARYDAATSAWQSWITGLKLRDDDRFSNNEKPGMSFSFITTDARQYVTIRYVTGYGHYQDDIIQGQKIAAPGLPAAWSSRAGKSWLLANEYRDSEAWESPLMRLNTFDGFLAVNRGGGLQVVDPAAGDTRAGMMLTIPQVYGRDLDDVAIDTTRGEEWIRLGSTLYRPQETITALSAGSSAVTIGAEGFAEWRKLPPTGSVSISGASVWRLYDAGLEQKATGTGDGSTMLPDSGTAAYLVLSAPPGTRITLNLVQ
ncbi:serine hydrolase domain-containing protein [Trichlorobacter ammonificans]|uniref:CubicO group peptidase (Beta-lactamase class C family) n=1 Tax=Trichlorobacter ammonificans TaxID=2916410 RepID=A0ABM9D817_9BACT|nr:serine hydrolase domain-containing protein [Trichlorobacter ammonificans]CAH2031297.1 CubicO group peptidase (Beta-lactamase class C family) [Trichlorobacter ammonificans]